ncbi:MAG: M23 family metallopeptidase [Anaerolineae bacterium]
MLILLVVACQPSPTLTCSSSRADHRDRPLAAADRHAAADQHAASAVRLTRAERDARRAAAERKPDHCAADQHAAAVLQLSAAGATSILDVGNASVSRIYPYAGGTNAGRLQVHHGVDLVNPIARWCTRRAMASSSTRATTWTTRFAPINDYYGTWSSSSTILCRPKASPVYTLYGHMANVTAREGQVVREGDVVGIVGATGSRSVRTRIWKSASAIPFTSTIRATRNCGCACIRIGVLAGRVVDQTGAVQYGVMLIVRSSLMERQTYTYGDEWSTLTPCCTRISPLVTCPPGLQRLGGGGRARALHPAGHARAQPAHLAGRAAFPMKTEGRHVVPAVGRVRP